MSARCIALAQQPNVNGEATYVSFEVPGALGTYPMSINNSMAVTGYYYLSSAVTRGFLRGADGTMTTFSVRDGVWTEPESMNDAGDITGYYEELPGTLHGFIRYTDGSILTFDPPNNDLPGRPQTQPVSINAFDEVVGNYPYPTSASDGFTRQRTGVFTSLDFGDGADYETVVTGLNDSGSVVGYFAVDSGRASFLWHPDGFSTQFGVPVDLGDDGIQETVAQSINADGVIAGWYFACPGHCASPGITGGFVRSAQGLFTLFGPPGTLVTQPGSDVGGGMNIASLSAPRRLIINQEGAIVGSYTDAAGAQHGFVRNPYGTITSFDPPRGNQTTATGMNDAGVIAGSYYYDWNAQTAVGFLRLP